ncbi:unnamed protein product [Paramecium octaurelia]|uniref:Transmembrane protein n=1 Tax=Paramecium octaurelia TaxID=43137 RepID=A0A8S1U9H2_PAROT|nr:unnamed protein product [Paramecium octaurelia]
MFNYAQYLEPYFCITNSTDICNLQFFSNNGDQRKSCYFAKDFWVDQLPLLFHRIKEFGVLFISFQSVKHGRKQHTLNYPIISNRQLIQLIKLIHYIISGIISCLGIAFLIHIAQIQIAKWRVSIVRTYFLFQNLNQALIDQDNEIQRFLEVDELSHMKYYSLMKLYKNGQIQKYRSSIKQKFQDKQLALVFKQMLWNQSISFLSMNYFQAKVQEVIDFHNDVQYLELAFSNRSVHFIQSYANPSTQQMREYTYEELRSESKKT